MVDHQFTQELGLTHAEFFRSLPAAIEHRDYHVAGDRVQVEYDDGRQVTFVLGPEQRRRIALLSMPYCEIRFEFSGFSDQQLQAFTHRFDLYFRRGGG